METEAWLASAESDASAARILLTNGFYSQAVFYTHLSVEKALKALVLERLDLVPPPHTHNLVALLSLAVDARPDWVHDFLATLSPESVQPRYAMPPDDDVYTAEVASVLLDGAGEATQWLRQHLI